MEYRILGNSGIRVSRLCFGSLTIGPLQANLSIELGASVIIKALNMGVNFIDTAKFYKTYPYIKRALEIQGNRENVILSSRSYDYTYEGMKESVEEALLQLDTEYIDIFGLHEQESIHTLRGHSDALRYLVDAKNMGKIRAISISTHNIEAVEAAISMPEIDIIHPLYNYKGIGIGDGSINDMADAIGRAKKAGKGIYSMKPLGGGNLIRDMKKCFDFVLGNANIDSIATGMQSENEVIANVSIFENEEVPEDILIKLRSTNRSLHIDSWCEGCGNCAKRCTLSALKIIDGKCVVDVEKCRLCGYCSAVCPQFCIKVV